MPVPVDPPRAPVEGRPAASRHQAWLAFRVGALLLGTVALAPLAVEQTPPLQDYPQHLFGAHVWLNPESYLGHYTASLVPGPYALFFWLVGTLSWFMPLELAGRAVIALVHVLLVGFVLTDRPDPSGDPRWGLLLIFPAALGPMYYLGFAGFLLSLPLLLFALRAWLFSPERLRWQAVIWVLALFLAHPFSLLCYCGLTATLALARTTAARGRAQTLRSLALPVAALVALAAWQVLSSAPPASDASLAPRGAIWHAPAVTLHFAGLVFQGLSSRTSFEVVHVAGIGVALATVLLAMWRGLGQADASRRTWAAWLALCVLGLLALPFAYRHYTYINFRLVAVGTLLAACLAGTVPLGLRAGALVAACSVLLVGHEAHRQVLVSRHTSEVLPLVDAIPPGQRVLPLLFDHDTPELDPFYFDPLIHAHMYYHIRQGGGLSPHVFEAGLSPVRFVDGARRPSPSPYAPTTFSVRVHLADYQWVLLRDPPPETDRVFAGRAVLVQESGPWSLYHRTRTPSQ